jgi:hypothetical protein
MRNTLGVLPRRLCGIDFLKSAVRPASHPPTLVQGVSLLYSDRGKDSAREGFKLHQADRLRDLRKDFRDLTLGIGL